MQGNVYLVWVMDENVLAEGIVASPGIAVGRAHVSRKIDILEKIRSERVQNVTVEVEKLKNAGNILAEKLNEIKRLLPKEEQEIIDAQLLILDSFVSEASELIKSLGYSAAFAVREIYEKYGEMMRQGGELFALRAQDLRDLASRLVGLLSEQSISTSARYEVVIGEEIDPIEFLELANSGVKGLVTKEGGVTSHVAILARLRGIPYIIARKLDINKIRDGITVIVDALNGLIILEPSEEELKKYEAIAIEYRKLLEAFSRESKLEALTLDGHKVNIYCNIGNFEELRILDEYGCEGVGLFRVEFAYMQRSSPPTEEELYELFSKAAQILGEKPLTVRAPDIGGDKPIPFIELPNEANPQLGLRGVRLLFKYEDLLLVPLVRALLRASVHGKLRLMLPMVSTVDEVLYFQEVVERERKNLESSGVRTGRLELGVMIETPSAALLANDLVERGGLSFISFGTNDLTQYVLAADRGNSLVSYLYDELNPSVLRLISLAVKRAKGRAEIEVCGEVASKPLAIPLLIGLGVESLSVSPQFVGKVKYIIRRVTLSKIKGEVENIIEVAKTNIDIKKWSEALLRSSGITFIE
ncbi:MAG: phosphoenolpyruvate--protein phosphotransferase [Infirmifilum sp.]